MVDLVLKVYNELEHGPAPIQQTLTESYTTTEYPARNTDISDISEEFSQNFLLPGDLGELFLISSLIEVFIDLLHKNYWH